VKRAETEDILSFMQDYVDGGMAASTIRSVYAALLYHFRLRKCDEILFSPVVKMFVKGAQRLAPPPSQKTVIWDPEVPLDWLKNRERPTAFRPAGQEALLLLLLATGIRVDCASKLSATGSFTSVFCQIPFLLPRKTGHSKPQVIRRFHDNDRVCPVKAIEHFLSVSRSIRKPNEKFLFISSTGTRAHKDTLRHWVMDLLSETGIEASAGSCRSAAASAAFEREVEIDIILKSAGWKHVSTFRKYYRRQVLKPTEGYSLL
jgi:site-specific recombinase XerD